MSLARIIPFLFLSSLTGSVFLAALPVSLGEIEIGLESFDGYQEGTAHLSTDESGTKLEILIAYKGFGLDTVSWIFSDSDVVSLQEAAAQATWWRSRLLEMDVDQRVERDITGTAPAITYTYRGGSHLFDAADNLWRFVRQGRDYALLLTEASPGAERRRVGEKDFPVLILQVSGRELPMFRDMLSEANMETVLGAYAAQKNAIDAILESSPE